MAESLARGIWLAAGWLCVAAGVAGIFLPVVPTTPLMLLAAWCFSKGSERLHRWLLEHPRLGPPIRDWEENRVVPLRAKLLATAMIVPLIGYMTLATAAPPWTKALAVGLGIAGLAFIWSKPSRTVMPETAGD